MPEPEYVWLPKDRLLSFEELIQVSQIAVGLGVNSIRITGGEPLLRRDLPTLIRHLSKINGLKDLALTTNGVLLAPLARALKKSGLHRITLSLDSLQPERYAAFSGIDKLEEALQGLRAVQEAGFKDIKINAVAIRGFNDDELGDMLRFAGRENVQLRFIEYMDVGGATEWTSQKVLSAKEILRMLSAQFGAIRPLPGRGSAPSQSYQLENGQVFGIIGSVSEPFCGDCDRGRVTADGTLYTCLYAEKGVDLCSIIRGENGLSGLEKALSEAWINRRDRGAVHRTATKNRGAWVSADRLRREPRLEMHTRGG
jgi:GTP 3',8-cyclase